MQEEKHAPSEAEKLAEKEGITVAAAADRLRQRVADSAEKRKKQETKVDDA